MAITLPVVLIEESIREHALNDPFLANILSDRWYGPAMPQNRVYPCVTMTGISSTPVISHDGFSGQMNARYQVDIWTECIKDCLKLAYLIEKRFRPSRVGQIGGPNYQANVGYMNMANRTDFGKDVNLKIYRVMVELVFLYEVQ